MPDWDPTSKNYKLFVPSYPHDAKFKVSQSVDISGSERKKMVLENLPDNLGPSVLKPKEVAHVITTICMAMKPPMEPQEAEWFGLDIKGEIGEPGKLYAIPLSFEQVRQTNPTFLDLVRNAEFKNPAEAASEKKHFKDIIVSELRTEVVDVSSEQQQAVSHAFDPSETDLEPTR